MTDKLADLYWQRDQQLARLRIARMDLKACGRWQWLRRYQLRREIAGREILLADLDVFIADLRTEAVS